MQVLGYIRNLSARASYFLVICLLAHFVLFFSVQDQLRSSKSSVQLLSEKKSMNDVDFISIDMSNAASQEEEEHGGKKGSDNALESKDGVAPSILYAHLTRLNRFHDYSVIQFHPEQTTPPPEQI